LGENSVSSFSAKKKKKNKKNGHTFVQRKLGKINTVGNGDLGSHPISKLGRDRRLDGKVVCERNARSCASCRHDEIPASTFHWIRVDGHIHVRAQASGRRLDNVDGRHDGLALVAFASLCRHHAAKTSQDRRQQRRRLLHVERRRPQLVGLVWHRQPFTCCQVYEFFFFFWSNAGF